MRAADPRARRRAARRLRTLLAAALTLWLPAFAAAQPAGPVPATVTLGPGSALWLDGTSTVHGFECRTSTLALTLRRDEATADPADAATLAHWLLSGGVRGLDLAVPLAEMRSGKPALDRNMLKTLRAAEF